MTVFAYGYDEYGTGGGSGRYTPSVGYRYGYTVAESKPRYLGERGRREDAASEARRTAKEVAARLKELGAPSAVSWWIQKQTSQNTTTFEEPFIEAVETQ
ncbi:hypothetical protein [Mycobacteroides salmoniphilum]|uniref:hypothetical protein n=1 Tax=Mycobacteroides salmoniphilum TaxID=404941 RepID=UPI0012FF9DE2|nr:hypothetical protein [Mycobacteroides salmoniphilum]